MPSVEKMHWVKSLKTWERSHNGERYWVGYRKLKAEFPTLVKSNTKEGTRDAANAWWDKHVEQAPPPTAPNEQRIAYLRKVAAADDLLGENVGDPVRKIIKEYTDNPALAKQLDQEHFSFPSEPSLNARLLVVENRANAIPSNFLLDSVVSNFLDVKKTKVAAKNMAADSWAVLKAHMTKLKNCLGEDFDTRTINESTIEKFYKWLSVEMEQDRMSGDYATGIWRNLKQFIKYCWAARICDLPRNLDSADFRFGTVGRRHNVFAVEEVSRLVSTATPRSQLYSLLMLNCGMLNIDIAALTESFVHAGKKYRLLENETHSLTWRRHKRKKDRNAPVVTYKLWDETYRLLAQEIEVSKNSAKKAGTPHDRLLLTEDGRHLQDKRLDGGKLKKSDAIKLAMRRAIQAAGLNTNPRALRATGSSMFDGHDEFSRYELHYLGQIIPIVAKKHYSTPKQDRFDAALKWLGEQFGFKTSR